ncbi:MAG: hypothetical protein ACLFP4_05885 [Spirochaetales bacterium]
MANKRFYEHESGGQVSRKARQLGLLLIVLAAGLSPHATSQERWSPPIVPSPRPFSLNSYDVIDAVLMIRRARVLLYRYADGRVETLPVNTAESVWIGYDSAAYAGHKNRYDILLNGTPLDWGNTYIEYDGQMLNMQLLWTYRNQRPVPDVPYRLPEKR